MLISALRSRRALLRLKPELWLSLLDELRTVGRGTRESGAFLLGESLERPLVSRFALYHELDPTCLTGGIDFHQPGYQRLWNVCESEGLVVLGDAHTHPGAWVQQSGIDAQHPMLSRSGHVALIIPHFAQGLIRPREVGLHHYGGAKGWKSYTGRDVNSRLYVGRFA